MQQTEQDRLSLEDRKELEKNIKEQENKIKAMSISRTANKDTSKATADVIMTEVKELRRLRRMRR